MAKDEALKKTDEVQQQEAQKPPIAKPSAPSVSSVSPEDIESKPPPMKPAPAPKSAEGKPPPPSESKVILTACDWLAYALRDNLVDLDSIHQIRLNVADRNLTLAWKQLIPLVEGKRGAALV